MKRYRKLMQFNVILMIWILLLALSDGASAQERACDGMCINESDMELMEKDKRKALAYDKIAAQCYTWEKTATGAEKADRERATCEQGRRDDAAAAGYKSGQDAMAKEKAEAEIARLKKRVKIAGASGFTAGALLVFIVVLVAN